MCSTRVQGIYSGTGVVQRLTGSTRVHGYRSSIGELGNNSSTGVQERDWATGVAEEYRCRTELQE